MKRFICGIAVVALAMGLVADAASAQLTGNPVYAINPGVGVTLNADFGRGLNDDSGKDQVFAGRVVLGVPTVSFWVGGGLWDSRIEGEDKEVTLAGGAAINLIKAPILPVALTLQVGAGTLSCGDECSTLNVVAGPALRVNVPTPGVGVEPWVMPRVQYMRATVLDVSADEWGVGASAGLNISLPVGLGFHVAADVLSVGDPALQPVTVGAGIHYKIAVPSLGMPLVPVVN
jgi:hypothetical protein